MKALDLVGHEFGVVELVGNASLEVSSAEALDRVERGQLTFAKAGGATELTDGAIERLTGAAVICCQSLANDLRSNSNLTLLISATPRLSFMQLVARFFTPPPPPAGISSRATVDPGTSVDPTASIGPGCYIGAKCVVGANSVLHPNVTVHDRTRIGCNVVIHAGSVIGSDGFGYERRADGKLEKFPHLGGVEIEDDVEIGSNTSIDRGTLGNTLLRRGCKVDNQVHIAHNVVIGTDAVVIAQSMVGGSVRIGDRAWLAPAAVILNQVSIGADATVGLGAVVTKDVPAGQTVMGSPAVSNDEFKANRAALKALLNGS